jgi:hypothetical protein
VYNKGTLRFRSVIFIHVLTGFRKSWPVRPVCFGMGAGPGHGAHRAACWKLSGHPSCSYCSGVP